MRDNHVLVMWIPAHQGFEGNERADTLAKRGANNQDATSFMLPVPSSAWNMAIRKRTHDSIKTKITKTPPSHFKRVWRDKFKSAIQILDRGNLRKATMFLTGHSTLNYHLTSTNRTKFQKVVLTVFQPRKPLTTILGIAQYGQQLAVHSFSPST